MDINMPQMNGIEAIRRIKEEFPNTAVIGLSVLGGTHNSEIDERRRHLRVSDESVRR
jgi:DNA-binding NarL/FixJ family response regulator